MSRPKEYYIFDPGCPEIVVTSATPRHADFSKVEVPRRRAKSQDAGFLKVPRIELGGKRAKDSRASQRSRLLWRSPSTPALAQVIRYDSMELGAKFASKAPWALEGKGPQRLDLSLWRSRKSRLSTKALTVEDVSRKEVNKCSSTSGNFTGTLQRKPSPVDVPTVLVDINGTGRAKSRAGSFENDKHNREFRLLEDGIYRGDLEVTADVAALLKAVSLRQSNAENKTQ